MRRGATYGSLGVTEALLSRRQAMSRARVVASAVESRRGGRTGGGCRAAGRLSGAALPRSADRHGGVRWFAAEDRGAPARRVVSDRPVGSRRGRGVHLRRSLALLRPGCGVGPARGGAPPTSRRDRAENLEESPLFDRPRRQGSPLPATGASADALWGYLRLPRTYLIRSCRLKRRWPGDQTRRSAPRSRRIVRMKTPSSFVSRSGLIGFQTFFWSTSSR